MSPCHPSTQRSLPVLPAHRRNGHRNGLDAALRADMGLYGGLHGKTRRTRTCNPVPNAKRTLNAHVIIKVHEVGAP